MLLCTLVIVNSIGSSFAIRNSYAQTQQQQQQIQQAPTIAYKSPWKNNLQISSASSGQPLCQAGICNQSLNPATNTQTTNVGPDRFRNIGYYWTSDNTVSRGVDVGSSANNTYLAATAQGPNVNQEVRP